METQCKNTTVRLGRPFPFDASGSGSLLFVFVFVSSGGSTSTIVLVDCQPRHGKLSQQLCGGVSEDEDVPRLGVDETLLDTLVEQREQAVVVAVHVEQPHLIDDTNKAPPAGGERPSSVD